MCLSVTAAFLAVGDDSFVFLLAAFFVSDVLLLTFSLLAESTLTVFSTNVSFFAFLSLLIVVARVL